MRHPFPQSFLVRHLEAVHQVRLSRSQIVHSMFVVLRVHLHPRSIGVAMVPTFSPIVIDFNGSGDVIRPRVR